jgi:hypothetical protein
VDQAFQHKALPSGLAPFQCLGVKPYWSIDDSGLETLRQQYTKLTRSLHPDRFAGQGTEAMQLAEAKSAELNAAYALLRDSVSIADFVLRQSPGNQPSKSALPPALAADYFEVQEDPDNLDLVKQFKTALQRWVAECEASFNTVVERFPFLGLGEVAEQPWTADDLAMLQKSREALRFAHSMLHDYQQKFKDSHAHSD